MSDLSGIQKIIYSDDTTNTSMDQRAERKDPSLAIDTVDRAVRVMLDNERNEDGYKYEESYIYNLNADDIGPGLGWECLRLERAVVEDETGYVPTVNVYLVSADGKTEELVHGTEKGSAEWVYDKEKIEKFAKDCCTKDGGRGFVSTIDLGLTNPKVDVPPKPVVTTVDADNFMNLLEEKGISEAFYDITEEQGVYAELDSGFVPFEYRDQYRDIVESIREFDPCYGYIAGHDTTRTDNVEVKELTSPNEIQDFIKDFVGENPDLYDIDHVKIYIQSSDALTDGEIEGSYVPYIETEGIRLNGEQPEKLSIPVSNLVTIECHEKDAPANVVSRATTIMDGFGRTWNPEGNYSRLNIHNQDFGISSRLTMAAGRSNYLKEADQVLDMCGKEERDRIADQKEVKEELLNEKVFVMDSVSFFLSVGVDGNSPQRVYAQRVQDLKDNRTEIENQYLRTMTAKAYVSAKILPVHDAILEKVKTLRSEASKPKKEQDFEKVKKLERMIVQDVREYKGIYERYGVQALALHASNLEKAYDKNDPFLDESRYKETYETQTRWIKEFGPEEDTEVDKDLDARIGAFIGSSGVRGQLPAIESRELPDYSNSEIEHTIRSILEEIRDESNEKYSDLEGHKLITAISDRTGTLTIRTEGMVEGYPVLPPFARPDIIDKIKTERYYPITFQSDDQHDFIDNAILLRDDENKDKNLDLLTLAVRKIGADVGKMDHGENHHLFDIIKGNMLSQTFEKTLLINVINDIDKKKDGNEKIRIEKIFKDALSKTKEDVAKEENEEKKVDVSEEQREDNSPDEVTDEKSFYKVQTSPYAKIDPKQEVAISKEKQEELKKEAETEAKKDERVVEDPDKYDEVFKEKYDQKTEALKEKLTALKDEILHYNKQLSTYEDIPFKYRGQHAFYHAAKYEHDKAAYEYEKIGGAVGTGQFLSEKMSTLKMYCSLSDLCNCDYAKTLFLNILRGKPEQTISDIYKKEDGSNYKGRSHLVQFVSKEAVIRDKYLRPLANINAAVVRTFLPKEMKDLTVKEEKNTDKTENEKKEPNIEEKTKKTEAVVEEKSVKNDVAKEKDPSEKEDIEAIENAADKGKADSSTIEDKEDRTMDTETPVEKNPVENETGADIKEENPSKKEDIESAENPEKLTVHFIEDNISDKEEIDSSTIEEEESEVGSSNTDWLDEVGKKVEDEELEEKITENEEKEAPKTENEDIESDKEYLLEESEDKDAFEENTSGMETNIVDEMTSEKDSSADNDNNSEKVEDTDLGKTEEHMEDDVKENKMIPTGDIDKKNADKEEKREILLSREEKALKDKLENLPDTISSNQVSSDPDVKGLIGDIRKTAGGQNISDPIAKVVASLSIDKEKNDISDKKTKNICKGMESITKADGASVKIKNIIVKARNIIKDYQKPLGIVSPETRVLMTLSDRFTNYIESKIPLAAVRMDIKAYHDNFSGNISGFLSNVSKALGDTIDKYKMELKEKNALVVSRIDNIMNSISSVTGIDIDKAGAVIKDTIKGISIGVTKGIIAFFSYDPIVSPIEKQEESKPEDIEKNEEVTINDKETEWRATPNVTIMDADKTDSDLNENHKENIEQMSSDKISMAVDAEESMNNHLKEDNTEKEEIENLSPLKEDNVINNKQLNEKNDSISMEKNDKTQETMIDTNGSNNIEKIMEDTFHGETTVSSDKDHIIDNTPVQEDKKTEDVEDKKAEDFTDAAMAIESETKDAEKNIDAEDIEVSENDKTAQEEKTDIETTETTPIQNEDVSFTEDVISDNETKEDLKEAVAEYLEETDSSPLLEQTYDRLSEYDTMTGEEKAEFLENIVSGIEEYIEKNNDDENSDNEDIMAEKIGDLLADMAASMNGSLDDNMEIAKEIVLNSGMDNDMKETVINKAYEEIPGLIEKEPAEMEIGGVVSDGENAWMVNDVTVSPTNASADIIADKATDFESTNPISDALESLHSEHSLDTGIEQGNVDALNSDIGTDTGLNSDSVISTADENPVDTATPDMTTNDDSPFVNNESMVMQGNDDLSDSPVFDDTLSYPDTDLFSTDIKGNDINDEDNFSFSDPVAYDF